VELDLMRIVRELRTNGKTEIFIGTIPDGTAAPIAAQALDQAIARVASESGATVVDLHSVAGSDDETTAAHIARSFAAALRVAR
jgi:type IV pilus biogenesis protein CpaD/CtpE